MSKRKFPITILLGVANLIESGTVKFDQGDRDTCIIGLTYHLIQPTFGSSRYATWSEGTAYYVSRYVLGLTYKDAYQIFISNLGNVVPGFPNEGHITPAIAVAFIRAFVAQVQKEGKPS